MKDIWKAKKENIHKRTIDISTYEYDGELIIIEGVLKEDRYVDTHTITGETFPQGTIHHMSVRLLVNCSTFVIEDLDMELLHVPREICRETMGFLAPIKGMTIARGFTAKVKKLVGGNKGCTHVVELLLAMAPTVLQGVATHRAHNPSGVDSGQARLILKHLINTCHAWREDGPFVAQHKKMLEMKAREKRTAPKVKIFLIHSIALVLVAAIGAPLFWVQEDSGEKVRFYNIRITPKVGTGFFCVTGASLLNSPLRITINPVPVPDTSGRRLPRLF